MHSFNLVPVLELKRLPVEGADAPYHKGSGFGRGYVLDGVGARRDGHGVAGDREFVPVEANGVGAGFHGRGGVCPGRGGGDGPVLCGGVGPVQDGLEGRGDAGGEARGGSALGGGDVSLDG